MMWIVLGYIYFFYCLPSPLKYRFHENRNRGGEVNKQLDLGCILKVVPTGSANK